MGLPLTNQSMWSATSAAKASQVTPAHSRPWKNSCFRVPKKPSALALSGQAPLRDMDLVAQGVLYACMFAALALVGRDAGMGACYWAGLAVALLLVAGQFVTARTRAPAACFRAFVRNNRVGMSVFIGIALDFALRG